MNSKKLQDEIVNEIEGGTFTVEEIAKDVLVLLKKFSHVENLKESISNSDFIHFLGHIVITDKWKKIIQFMFDNKWLIESDVLDEQGKNTCKFSEIALNLTKDVEWIKY